MNNRTMVKQSLHCLFKVFCQYPKERVPYFWRQNPLYFSPLAIFHAASRVTERLKKFAKQCHCHWSSRWTASRLQSGYL